MSSDNIGFWYAEEDGNAFEDALIALMKPTMNYANVQVGDSLKLKAQRYILENLMQSSLSPKVVADHIGVSLRHLYRLFMVDQQSMASDLTRVSLELGGKAQEGTGYFVEPTLLKVSGVDDPLFIEETFGPVVDVIPFETDEELIEMMNHSRFGLTASLWTNDLSKALRLIPQIDAGSIWINMHTFLDPAVPFGGVKASGVGREFSDAFIEDYTEVKSVMIRY